ncbi:hypothetical protein Q1695_005644 [Nippostrongylus brasiliensis]|nr:hypothetical protein Q1695_005644 [Nippostrongylus brasiliensis]
MTSMFSPLGETQTESHSSTQGEVPLCRVCERAYDGSQHFGIEVCRACAAFFRRSVEGRKKFLCRKGGDGCRLNVVRTRARDSIPSCPPELKTEIPSSHGEMLPCSSQVDVPKEVLFLESTLRFQQGTIFRPIPTVNPVYPPDSGYPRPNLICKALRNYRKLYADRWAMELAVPGLDGAPTYNSGGGKIISLCTMNRLSDILRRQTGYITKFVLETFDDFATLTQAEQEAMISGLFGALWELEGSYWTYRNLPEQQSDKMMLSLTTYSDLNNLEYLINGSCIEPMDINQLKQVITSLQLHIRRTLLDQMHGIILSEVEFVALFSLTIWSPRFHRGFEKAERIASKYRAQIFHDLHSHYRDERKMDNYAIRFGDVMCLFVDLQMNGTRIGEDVELLKLFNMYRVDSYIYDCFNVKPKRT